jgi:MurNAc alpha-1-phosphate uridylyltransferase
MPEQHLSDTLHPRKAMLFAAGLGTRLKPWTDHHPKALAMVNGKSLLQRNIEYLQQNGIHNVVVNVHHFADQIIEAIKQNNGWGSKVTISDETEEVLETGGGLLKAAPLFAGEENIVVMNADILTDMPLTAMMDVHLRQQPLATLAVSKRNTSRYFLFDEALRLSGWENVKTGEVKKVRDTATIIQMAFSGIHIINTNLFSLISRAGKFSMVDVYLDLAPAHVITGFDHTGSLLLDVGKPESLIKAEALFS